MSEMQYYDIVIIARVNKTGRFVISISCRQNKLDIHTRARPLKYFAKRHGMLISH